jgi:acyl-CoA reductase-like NAD-dependent aldehyde dehydrogenase
VSRHGLARRKLETRRGFPHAGRIVSGIGGVLIGDVPSWRVDNMPYGGVKDSGLGREGVRFAMEDMSEIRNMLLRYG